MKDYGTWWITVPPEPMKWSKEMTDADWAVECARHCIKVRQARWRFGFACALLISVLMWVALIEGGAALYSVLFSAPESSTSMQAGKIHAFGYYDPD